MKSWTTHKHGCAITRVLFGRSNVFLIAEGSHRVLVDTSPGRHWKKLDRGLRHLGVEKLDALVLTHTHYDHAGNAQRVKERYAPPVIVHRAESGFLETGFNDGEGIVVRGTNVFTRIVGQRIVGRLLPRVTFTPCRADIVVEDRLALDDYGVNAYLLHTPGHSIGSMSVIVDDEVAICGDALFGVFPGRVCPPWAYDDQELLRSWGRLLATGARLFLPSHGSARAREVVQAEYDRRLATRRP